VVVKGKPRIGEVGARGRREQQIRGRELSTGRGWLGTLPALNGEKLVNTPGKHFRGSASERFRFHQEWKEEDLVSLTVFIVGG